MHPTDEQVAVAAYHRWQRRGGEHGLDHEGIEVSLSEKAAEVVANCQTIVLEAYFDGDGMPLPDENPAPYRDVFLGEHSMTILHAGTVIMSDAKVSESAIQRLTDSNYYFSIHVGPGSQPGYKRRLTGRVAGRIGDNSPVRLNIMLLSELNALR